MSGLQRMVRHPDRRPDAHARAIELISDRLLEPISDADAAWLDEHLAGCPDCRYVGEGFAADASLLAGLRDAAPPPPRDLAARLSSALDREVPRTVAREQRAASIRRVARRPQVALAGLAVAAVIAIVALPLVAGLGAPGPSSVPDSLAAATPIPVPPNPVAWLGRNAAGNWVLSAGTVDHVCPDSDPAACGTLDGTSQVLLPLTMNPDSVLIAPSGGDAVVVSDNGVYAVPVPRAVTRSSPRPSPHANPGAPSPTPAATGVPTSPPVGTPVPTGSASSGPVPTVVPTPSDTAAIGSASPVASTSEEPSAGPSGASPSPGTSAGATPGPSEPSSSAIASAGASELASPSPDASPSGEPLPSQSASPLPSGSLTPATPAPTAAASYAIARNVVLVGAPASYSPDGQWVAFSARPADGRHGPDLYVWAVGDPTARVLSTNHATIFSGWLDDQVLVSVPVVSVTPDSSSSSPPASPVPSPGPSGGRRSASPSASPALSGARHSASPTASDVEPSPPDQADGSASATPRASASATPSGSPATFVAAPATADPGSVVARSFIVDPDTGTARAVGTLGVWRPVVDPTSRTVVYWTGAFSWSPSQAAWVPTDGALAVASWHDVRARGGSPQTAALPGPAGSGPVVAWDVRFDPSGRHLAVWIADRAGAAVGGLSLIDINPDGSLGKTRYRTDAALRNYSLDADRLAWATPPGQNGEGSMVAVYAWTADGGGRVDSAPASGTDQFVVAH